MEDSGTICTVKGEGNGAGVVCDGGAGTGMGGTTLGSRSIFVCCSHSCGGTEGETMGACTVGDDTLGEISGTLGRFLSWSVIGGSVAHLSICSN